MRSRVQRRAGVQGGQEGARGMLTCCRVQSVTAGSLPTLPVYYPLRAQPLPADFLTTLEDYVKDAPKVGGRHAGWRGAVGGGSRTGNAEKMRESRRRRWCWGGAASDVSLVVCCGLGPTRQ